MLFFGRLKGTRPKAEALARRSEADLGQSDNKDPS